MRILVVEDDPDLSKALVRALEKRGFAVTPCFDGLKAFQAIRQDAHDIIILDLTFPARTACICCSACATPASARRC